MPDAAAGSLPAVGLDDLRLCSFFLRLNRSAKSAKVSGGEIFVTRHIRELGGWRTAGSAVCSMMHFASIFNREFFRGRGDDETRAGAIPVGRRSPALENVGEENVAS